jgi:hypothetical protein
MHTQGECRDDPQFLVSTAALGVSVVAGVIRDIVAVDEVHELPGPTDRGAVLVVEVNVGFRVEVSFRAFREAIAPIGAVVGFVKQFKTTFARDGDGLRKCAPVNIERTNV